MRVNGAVVVVAIVAMIMSTIALVRGGPIGPTGATGAQGLQGVAGPQGVQGVAGPAGAAGATGTQGPVGPAGLAGAKGDKGDRGEKGAKGDQGIPGVSYNNGVAVPTGLTGSQTATLSVMSSGDDCVVSRTQNTFDSTYWQLETGYSGYAVALRINFSSVPRGAMIDSAVLQVTASNTVSGAGYASWVSMQASSNAQPIYSLADFLSKPRTGSRIDWSSSTSWLAGTVYSSPDLTPILQELVNSSYYIPGYVMIFWGDDDLRSAPGGYRLVYSYDGAPSNAPRLLLSWH